MYRSFSSIFPYTRKHPGLFALRHKMWELIASRSHRPIKIFPFGEINERAAEAEVMIYGTVDYGFKAGGGERKEWAASVEMVRDGEGEWKMRLYQVYLVSLVIFCDFCMISVMHEFGGLGADVEANRIRRRSRVLY